MRNYYLSTELPPGQSAIETPAVVRFFQQMTMLVDAKPATGYAMMGVVTGKAGMGKTIACMAFADGFEPKSHTLLPPCIYFRIPKRPTPDRVAKAVLTAMNYQFDPELGQSPVEQAVDIINDNEIFLLIADEADNLDSECFDILRHIHDEAHVSVAVVGLPAIRRVVELEEKFKSRVGINAYFKRLSKHDMLNTVLPNLIFPYWQFDPTDENDLQMGEFIYKQVRSSLRRTRTLLQNAVLVAGQRNVECINLEIIKITMTMANFEDNEDEDEDNDLEQE